MLTTPPPYLDLLSLPAKRTRGLHLHLMCPQCQQLWLTHNRCSKQMMTGSASLRCALTQSPPQLSQVLQHVQHQNSAKTDKQHQAHICTIMVKCDQINYLWTAFVSLLNEIQFLQSYIPSSATDFLNPTLRSLISWFFARV